MLVDYATAHFLKSGKWCDVFAQLKAAGFAPVARMTLVRHVQRRKAELDVQNSDPCHY
jgi:hypothetical protein